MGSRYDRLPDGDHETEWVEFAEAAERAESPRPCWLRRWPTVTCRTRPGSRDTKAFR
jgi:hypothetical protein